MRTDRRTSTVWCANFADAVSLDSVLWVIGGVFLPPSTAWYSFVDFPVIVFTSRVHKLVASALTAAANTAGEASDAPSEWCRLRVVLYAKWDSASGVGRNLVFVSADRSGKYAEAGGDGVRGPWP